MKKFVQFLSREGILQVMGIVFLLAALVTAVAANLGPLQLPEASRGAYYAHENVRLTWLFMLMLPIVISVAVGGVITVISLARRRHGRI